MSADSNEPDLASGASADAATAAVPPAFEDGLYNEDGHLREDFTEAVRAAVDGDQRDELLRLTLPLHGSEMGDLLEALESEERQKLVRLAGDEFDFSALTEVDEAIRLDIVDSLPNEYIAGALQDLDSDDAIYILEDMDEKDQHEVLEQLPFDERILLRRALDYPEESAGRRMQTEFIAVPPFWTVGQTIDYMREDDDLPNRFHEIFVISPQYELLGYVQLDKLLRTKRQVRIEEVMEETVHPIKATDDQEEAAYVFQQYDLLSAAVVDDGGRLVGVMTIDDIVDVIHEEAEEDIKRLAGVGDEELSDTVVDIARSRFLWLLINLATAILASTVIGLFDATIEQMVALAVLMPIVASMGGNAGTQTMTVAVRALATRDMDSYNTRRIIRREVLVGLLNGLAFALLIGIVAAWWFSQIDLGVIIAVAMVFNMLSAALAGILIPLLLNRLDLDPAIASSVFVTTVTDVVGFFAFLGLAAWWFGI
ncbi:MAG: magnesium transporter [Nitratireductor sp.]|nr:magnesium transporter [Nitratireductor sp.]